MKILIAETLDSLRTYLCNELKHRHTVYSCTDGKKALELIVEQCPDILVLDIGLSGFDGLSILRALSYSSIHPKILVTTDIASEYVVKQLHDLEIDYILLKPCSVCTAMAQIYSLISTCEQSDDPDEYREYDLYLHGLGFNRCRSGYDCVRQAMHCVHSLGLKMMTKEVYPAVAKLCGGNAVRVEKAIRDAIHDAWAHRHSTFWHLYFPVDRNGDIPCPTNAQFIWAFPGLNKKNEKKMNIL